MSSNYFLKDMASKKAAFHRKGDDHLFYYGLAMAYFKLGDLEKAEKNINKAKYYIWDEEKKAYYDHGIRW